MILLENELSIVCMYVLYAEVEQNTTLRRVSMDILTEY